MFPIKSGLITSLTGPLLPPTDLEKEKKKKNFLPNNVAK